MRLLRRRGKRDRKVRGAGLVEEGGRGEGGIRGLKWEGKGEGKGGRRWGKGGRKKVGKGWEVKRRVRKWEEGEKKGGNVGGRRMDGRGGVREGIGWEERERGKARRKRG